MCGQIGIAGTLSLKTKEMFKTLLHVSTLRGEDSTGIASVDKNNKYSIHKVCEPAINILDYKKFDRVIDTDNVAWLGHNRKATYGKISNENAHPFFFPYAMGTHNGTLPYWDKGQLEKQEKFETDSEALMYAISENKGNWPDFKVNGAWAVAWFSFHDQTINLLRNDERPLYYTFTKDKKTLIWASEQIFISFAAIRHGIEIEPIYGLEPYIQRIFKIPKKDEAFDKIKIRTVKGFISETEKKAAEEAKKREEEERKERFRNNSNKHNSYREENLPFYSHKHKENKVPIIGLNNVWLNHTGLVIDRNKFQSTSGGHCALCSAQINSPDNFIWISFDSVICGDCVDDTTDNPNSEIAKLLETTYPLAYEKIFKPKEIVK